MGRLIFLVASRKKNIVCSLNSLNFTHLIRQEYQMGRRILNIHILNACYGFESGIQ